jgi:hypothetical protein
MNTRRYVLGTLGTNVYITRVQPKCNRIKRQECNYKTAGLVWTYFLLKENKILVKLITISGSKFLVKSEKVKLSL